MSEPTRPILTAVTGTNADLIRQVANLYIPDGAVVADVTYGKGVFWQQVDTGRFEFLPTDLLTGTDFRDLPYGDAEIDVVVLDPPYLYNPKDTIKESISSGYRLNQSPMRTTEDVLNFYYEGMAEAQRVLSKRGLLMVKCQDGIEAGRQRWQHIRLHEMANDLGFYGKDLFVLQALTVPAMRWKHQKHARKNHSYLWIFEKRP